ncbi:hypothetical protein [Pareuzebyella sediminis]|uniref:hypothetical protein n=1 Tax=Pareuzebyella sediminis TaxID=2607998 RepID=UPI0011EF169A|nr:hypothetical protein [Pareuzebyella sediminis]
MKSYINILLQDIKKITFKEHLYYWILPLLVLTILMTLYFSGIPQLVQLVCPSENWEWGILENLQLVIILIILIFSIYGFINKKNRILKLGFAFVVVFSVFILLEEMDYGAHFAQLIGGEKEVILKQYIPHNIHNVGNNAKLFKRVVILIMALIFVVAPFMESKVENPYILYLIPKPRIIIIAVLTIAADLIPRLIVAYDIFEDGGLGVNINEFQELMVYYIFLIYLLQLIFDKQLQLKK